MQWFGAVPNARGDGVLPGCHGAQQFSVVVLEPLSSTLGKTGHGRWSQSRNVIYFRLWHLIYHWYSDCLNSPDLPGTQIA